ncbi:MAG: glycosyltransferase [Patescibacteria group bacterium]
MNKFLLEVSWEVANKVGGIYTVLSEKAHYIKEKFGDDYFVVGPFLKDKGFQDFYQFLPDEDLGEIINEAEKYGIKIYYGEWLIDGRPKGFLVDFENLKPNANAFKYELWEKYKIDSSRVGDDYNEPIVWSKAVSIFLKAFCERFREQKKVFHFHEWLSGAALLFLDSDESDANLKTAFTIHATVLGRTLASADVNFWENLNSISPDKEIYKFGIEAKYGVEKYASQKASYFTAVSSVLGKEAETFLGRKPDFILPNGLNFDRFSTNEEIAHAHRKNREILKEFILFFFAPYYKVDVKNSLIMFISGRKEIKNKGIDVFIRSLGKLNKILNSGDKNIFVFIFVPDEVYEEDNILRNNLNVYKSIESIIDEMGNELKGRLINYLIHKKEVSSGSLFSNDEFLTFKKIFSKVKKDKEIPLSTHKLKSDNQIIGLLKEANLSNKIEDRVRVIYYPSYINSSDGLLNLNYEDVVSGSHVGVFPSFYEPWGYTPLETSASGVISVTTNLTGFADYLKENVKFNNEDPGIFILNRTGDNIEKTIDELTKILSKIAKIERPERAHNKQEARRLAEFCRWENLIKNYFALYNKAFS